MSRLSQDVRALSSFFTSSLIYILFAIAGIFAGIIALILLGALGLLLVAFARGTSGPEMHLAVLSILGMAFYLGLEVANDFTIQFTDLKEEVEDNPQSPIEETDKDENESEKPAPLDFIAVFLWIGGIIVASVAIAISLLGTPLAWLAIPFALLAGVVEMHLSFNEIPGPMLLLAIAPFMLIYTITGFTSTVRDLLPQRIALRNIQHFQVRRTGR